MDSSGAQRPDVPRERSRHLVSDSVEWSALRGTTRTRATVTSFGWRGKLLLSALPPVLFLLLTAPRTGLAAALLLGTPTFAVLPLWWKHVWAPGPCERTAAEVRRRTDTSSAPFVPPPDRATAHPNLAFLHDAPPRDPLDGAA